MPLHLMPGEAVLWTSVTGRNVSGWRDDDDAYVTLTSHRLALTYSESWGGQSGAQYLPLERIDSVTHRLVGWRQEAGRYQRVRDQNSAGWYRSEVLGLELRAEGWL